jgi:organic hydroperoxide reductase OsmC/OhrA
LEENLSRLHRYQTTTTWTGNLGSGTSQYTAYSRNLEINAPKKAVPIQGSSDPVFRGDPTRYNPEDLLVGALSACHMLWVLHLCANA